MSDTVSARSDLLGSTEQGTPTPPAATRAVLLVHGAWHTGQATWGKVAALLRSRGLTVEVAELHRGSLSADTAAVAGILETLSANGAVVVCGHSYGGAVITGLPCAHLAHLVYLCAIMPDLGETAFRLASHYPPTEIMSAVRPMPTEAATTYLDPDLAGHALYGHLSEPEREKQVTRLVPQIMTGGDESPASVAWRLVLSTYVVATDDHTIHPALQRELSTRASTRVEWDSDHAPFAGELAPAVVDLLDRLARTEARAPESDGR